jgi:hypothetical protein
MRRTRMLFGVNAEIRHRTSSVLVGFLFQEPIVRQLYPALPFLFFFCGVRYSQSRSCIGLRQIAHHACAPSEQCRLWLVTNNISTAVLFHRCIRCIRSAIVGL